MPNYWYDHVHLVSPEPVKTAQFYETMFNAKRVSIRELSGGRVSVELSLNGSRVLIAQAQGQITPGMTSGLEHWGIRTDDIEGAVANLKANGVKFRNEIIELLPGVKLAFLWAPDNVLIEILEIRPAG